MTVLITAETFGSSVRNIRLHKGLTLKQLGAACGIPGPNISRYESGRVLPRVDTLERIATALNVVFVVEPQIEQEKDTKEEKDNVEESV